MPKISSRCVYSPLHQDKTKLIQPYNRCIWIRLRSSKSIQLISPLGNERFEVGGNKKKAAVDNSTSRFAVKAVEQAQASASLFLQKGDDMVLSFANCEEEPANHELPRRLDVLESVGESSTTRTSLDKVSRVLFPERDVHLGIVCVFDSNLIWIVIVISTPPSPIQTRRRDLRTHVEVVPGTGRGFARQID